MDKETVPVIEKHFCPEKTILQNGSFGAGSGGHEEDEGGGH